jgi:ELWxxDGT repeat protein
MHGRNSAQSVSPRARKYAAPATAGVEGLECRVLLAAQPAGAAPGPFPGEQLVSDINTGTLDANPRHTVVVDGVAFFFATDGRVPPPLSAGSVDRSLWRSDGTPQGTRIVKALTGAASTDPRGAELEPRGIVAAGSRLFFAALEAGGMKVWTSDGTEAGTVSLGRSIYVYSIPDPDVSFHTLSVVSPITTVGGTAYWASKSGNTYELWKSDGTTAGTVRLKTFTGTSPGSITPVNGTLFFRAGDAGAGGELWKSDGTEAGTIRVKDILPGTASSNPTALADVGGTLYFTAAGPSPLGAEIWRSDGTEAGTVLVAAPGGADSSATVTEIKGVAGVAYASVRKTASGGAVVSELWRSDGTAAGTALVTAGVSAADLTAVAGKLYFRGTDAAGSEPWVSDGTPGGTVRLADASPGAASSLRAGFTVVAPAAGGGGSGGGGSGGGGAYFAAAGAVYHTDGTPGGTARVPSAAPPSVDVTGWLAPATDGRVFFSGDDHSHGTELMITDGTAAGTRPVADINRRPRGSFPSGFFSLGDQTYFFANPTGINSSNQDVLYRTDGTPAGTVPVKQTGFDGWTPVQLDGVDYFGGTGGLWRTDGTAEGTYVVDSHRPEYSQPVRAGNTLYFAAFDATYGPSVWMLENSPGGPTVKLVVDAGPGKTRSDPHPEQLTVLGNQVYMAVNAWPKQFSMFVTDGTPEGTWQVAASNIFPMDPGAGFVQLTAGRDALYYLFTSPPDYNRGFDLWRVDPVTFQLSSVANVSPGMTSFVPARILNADGTLYVVVGALNDGTAAGIFKSDGTPAGTTRVLDEGPLFGLGTLGSRLIFPRVDADHGLEPWITDGTPGGTHLMADLTPGPTSTSFDAFTPGGDGLLYFTATADADPRGLEVWRTDGTSAGSYKVTDLARDASRGFSEPSDLFYAPDGSLYFQGGTGSYNAEPWRVPPAGAAGAGGATVSGQALFYDGADLGGPLKRPVYAPDKRALLPGEGAGSFANVSSFAGGINGVAVDIAGLRPGRVPNADDVSFAVGAGGPGDAWSQAPAPSTTTVRPGAGVNGSDRIEFTWPNGSIRNKWLRVTVKAGDSTGLLAPHVFYFGSLAGETGDALTPLRVSAADLAGVKRFLNTTAGPDSRYDINRDGKVNALDLGLVRAGVFQAIKPIVVPAPATASIAPAVRPVWDASHPGVLTGTV